MLSPRNKFTSLERKQRKSARLALYGSLLITAVLACALFYTSVQAMLRSKSAIQDTQDWYEVDWESLPEVRIFQDYLRIDTNADDGSEAAGAEFLAKQIEAVGIPTVIERFADNKANLWAILEGEDPQAVVLHSHIDVEPVNDPGVWKYPPFSGTIAPPWIYSRGAFDMKSLAAAQLHAFLELKKKGVPLKRTVIFLATGSEERGSDLGSRWIVQQHPELVERFWVVLTEGGVVEAVDQKKVKYWGIEVGQKRFIDLVICSQDFLRLKGIKPELRAVKSYPGPRRKLPEGVATMFESYAETRDSPELVEMLSKPESLVEDEAVFSDAPSYIKAMVRNELRASPILEKEDGSFYRILRLHVLPGEDIHEARRELVPDWMLFGLDWTIHERKSADFGSSPAHPAFEAIQQVLHDRYPEAPSGPYFLPWTATDSRFFRQAGVPSFGFSPFLILTPDTMTANHPNERVSLPGYVEGVAIYTQLLEHLAL